VNKAFFINPSQTKQFTWENLIARL
jgi:hypothetical protein